ncbi:MAG: hypothetical protein JEZ10_04160 [Verrucomicrobia bacterium]|nr:hypothetical protein [Verrucomicrobiota bacterium]
MKWDREFIGFVVFAALLGCAGSYFGQPLIHGNDQAVGIIVTVYSILAGFLVAIIAIVGDPLLIPSGSWRIAEGSRKKTIQRLTRHKHLFYIYLLSLAFAFAAALLKDECPRCTVWMERIYLFLSIFAFALSLCLPSALMRLQQERLDHIIEDRRNRSGQK